MNIFRFIADMLHVVAIILLIYRIKKSRNCIGKYKTVALKHQSHHAHNNRTFDKNKKYRRIDALNEI